MKTRLIIVRHAEAEGNIIRRFHGWTDGELTDKGHIQAERVAERLKDIDIDILYSSTLKRTLQTAGYISNAKSLPIIRTDKMKEINGGDWEGKTWDELPVLWPKEHDTWENEPHLHKMPGGETMAEFYQRLVREVENIISSNQGKTICIVTHGTAIRALTCRFLNKDLEAMIDVQWHDNTSVTMVDYEQGKYSLVLEGDTSHLGEELSTIGKQEWWIEYKKRLLDRVSEEN